MDVAFGIQKIVVIKVHILKKILCQSLFSLHDIKDIMSGLEFGQFEGKASWP